MKNEQHSKGKTLVQKEVITPKKEICGKVAIGNSIKTFLSSNYVFAIPFLLVLGVFTWFLLSNTQDKKLEEFHNEFPDAFCINDIEIPSKSWTDAKVTSYEYSLVGEIFYGVGIVDDARIDGSGDLLISIRVKKNDFKVYVSGPLNAIGYYGKNDRVFFAGICKDIDFRDLVSISAVALALKYDDWSLKAEEIVTVRRMRELKEMLKEQWTP